MSNRHRHAVMQLTRRISVVSLAASLLCLASLPARAQETIRMTIAAGHPPIFLWVKLFSESFIPTVDAELARTGKYKIAWTEAYGGTLAKIGSELETMQKGISDVGTVGTIFHSSKMPLNNVSFFVPFGPSDTDVVTKAISSAQETPEMKAEWAKYNLVHLASVTLDSYQILTNFAFSKIEDLKGRKIGGAGANLNWIKNTGAVGVQGNLSTFYNDLKTGVYDGTMMFATGSVPAKLFEVAPNLVKIDFGAMATGALAINKSRWEKLPEEVKAAFRKGALVYQATYQAEQIARTEAALTAWQRAGGKIITLDAADRARFVKMVPNPLESWFKQAGEAPAKKVLAAYMNAARATGFKFARDFDKE
jgi:TRAP-type C4-dicarboxylate transport system substrate-binding protein